ncbi:M48 family metalloprotease [Actinoplanes sp. NPDC049118]|uniref:M48 family metallopeptidase n=1 Tax=Actinoplanes sp. NPDC049118 TaxID=3155769 RepID=UPI0033CFBA3F
MADAAPWCGACEWNLDDFAPAENVGWVWRRIDRWDSRAGFRVDRRIVEAYLRDPEAPVPQAGFRLLVLISAVLMLLLFAAVAAGVRLIVHGGGLPLVLLGALLLGAAWLLRPRLGRLKQLVRESHVVSAAQAPALHGLVERIARESGTPVPDVLALDYSWNAFAGVVGIRRTKVLVLGVPLLLALGPQQLVALIGHELGHLHHEDSSRRLLTQPARTAFGTLSALLRPPPRNAVDPELSGLYAFFLLLWQTAGGLVSLLLFAVHLGVHILDSRDSRRAELRADAMSVRAAGSEAALELVNLLPLVPDLRGYVQPHVPEGRRAGDHWRRMLTLARDRGLDSAELHLQLSIRSRASLLASHPAPGRRRQWMAGLPQAPAAVAVSTEAAAEIEAELIPYAAAMHRWMLDD